MLMLVYDHRFNQNEWFVIISLAAGLTLFWRFKNRFTVKEVIAYFLYSFFIGIVLDHSISVKPFDFYDVNDNSSYQFIDFLTYLMYAPFGYIFIFCYDYFKIKFKYTPLYILVWVSISIGMEFFAHILGVYHYKNGYEIYYSFPIYLLAFSAYLCLYRFLHTSINVKN
jgi:hypothetical protein